MADNRGSRAPTPVRWQGAMDSGYSVKAAVAKVNPPKGSAVVNSANATKPATKEASPAPRQKG
jgi:hypothetical protein